MTKQSQPWPEDERGRLIGLAYRMVGTVADAEDIVQDAYLRWQRADTGAIERPFSWLATTVSRLAIDHMRSARKRREVYVGPWLPEPIIETEADMPIDPVERTEDISFAMMLVLDQLAPKERAAFLLREVFDFGYDELAEALGETQANSRQLVSRARRRLDAEQDTLATPPRTQQKTLIAFAQAIRDADAPKLLSLLREDAVLVGDGGGKALTALNPIHGADRINRFYMNVPKKVQDRIGFGQTFTVARINGRPALIGRTEGKIDLVVSIIVDQAGHIVRILQMNNPDKLERANAHFQKHSQIRSS